MLRELQVVAAVGVFFLAACRSQPKPVEVFSGAPEAGGFALTSLRGTRDGDRLEVQAMYGDGSRRLLVDLRFRLTPQAKLERGTWAGPSGEGRAEERSVTFLGGQSGPPSIGGRFDLFGPNSRPMYRISIPLQPLQDTL